MVKLVFAALLSAGATSPARVFRLVLNGKPSHLALIDHKSLDTTSFEVQALTRLVERSCELVLDDAPLPVLDDRRVFRQSDLSLAARRTLDHLGLGHLGMGTPPISLKETWRQVYVASESHLAAQMEAYASAREHDQSLAAFGPAKLDQAYHLTAQYLLGSQFTDAALIEAAQRWYETEGPRFAKTAGTFRRWAEHHLPADERGVTDLNAGLTMAPRAKRLNLALLAISALLPTVHTATNFWNHHVSLFLRNVLKARYFETSYESYRMLRATLDWGDRYAGVSLSDDLVALPVFDWDHWLTHLLKSLDAGHAFVVVDPLPALPANAPSLLDYLGKRGVDVRPLPLRGFRPRLVE